LLEPGHENRFVHRRESEQYLPNTEAIESPALAEGSQHSKIERQLREECRLVKRPMRQPTWGYTTPHTDSQKRASTFIPEP